MHKYVAQEKREGILLFLDMEKAFDRCSWEFILEGLGAVGFNNSFANYVRLAYSDRHPPRRQIDVCKRVPGTAFLPWLRRGPGMPHVPSSLPHHYRAPLSPCE